MDNHLGYGKYERSEEPNYRNGTKSKCVRSKYGEFEVEVPRTARALLSLRLFQSIRKISLQSMTRSSPCTQKA